MFTDPNFQIDRESSEYHLINPLVSKLDRVKAKKERQRQIVQKQFEPVKVKQNFYDYSQWNFFFFLHISLFVGITYINTNHFFVYSLTLKSYQQVKLFIII